MKLFLKNALLITCTIFMTNLAASSAIDDSIDYDKLAEQCRSLSLQLDTLAQTQDRKTCSANLDGLNVYFASNYILLRWTNKATEVLTSAIFQVEFAHDTGCYYEDEIQNVVNGLKLIRDQLIDSRQ